MRQCPHRLARDVSGKSSLSTDALGKRSISGTSPLPCLESKPCGALRSPRNHQAHAEGLKISSGKTKQRLDRQRRVAVKCNGPAAGRFMATKVSKPHCIPLPLSRVCYAPRWLHGLRRLGFKFIGNGTKLSNASMIRSTVASCNLWASS